jgi:hypothetical protein
MLLAQYEIERGDKTRIVVSGGLLPGQPRAELGLLRSGAALVLSWQQGREFVALPGLDGETVLHLIAGKAELFESDTKRTLALKRLSGCRKMAL